MLATEDYISCRADGVLAYLGRKAYAMKMAIYSCMKCGLEFESSWGGGAFMMAIKCIRCEKGVAVSSESLVFESGCLTVIDEIKL